MTSSISLPIVVIFERHWDEVPKQLVKDLLPQLAEEGYDTLCFEAPQNLSEKEILSSHKYGLDLNSKICSQAEECLKRAGINDIDKLSTMGFENLAHLMQLFVSSKKYNEVAEKIKHLPATLLLKDIFNKANQLS